MKKYLVIFAAVIVAACVNFGSSRPSNFYTLQRDTVGVVPISRLKTDIGVEEVKIPVYLDKPQMTTRQENGVKMELSEVNRWSEPLSVMMQQVLAADMAAYLPESVVKPRIYGNENFNYKVFVEVSRFEGSLEGDVVLNVWWYVFNKNGRQLIRRSADLKTSSGRDYDSIVMAQSRLTAELARQIAMEIAALK